MLRHALLRILLHAAVHRGENLQSVAVNVIERTVGLGVFVNPAVERVLNPLRAVVNEILLLPRRVVFTLRLVSSELHPYELAEVRGRAVLMVGTVEFAHVEWQSLERVALAGRDESLSQHLVQDSVATGERLVGTAYRVVERRVLEHAHQHGGLLNLQILGLAPEEGVCRALNAVSVIYVPRFVEVHGQYLIFRI